MPVIGDELFNFVEHHQYDPDLFLPPPPKQKCRNKRCKKALRRGSKPVCSSCKEKAGMESKKSSRRARFSNWIANPDAYGTNINFRGKVFCCEKDSHANGTAVWVLKRAYANYDAPKIKKKKTTR